MRCDRFSLNKNKLRARLNFDAILVALIHPISLAAAAVMHIKSSFIHACICRVCCYRMFLFWARNGITPPRRGVGWMHFYERKTERIQCNKMSSTQLKSTIQSYLQLVSGGINVSNLFLQFNRLSATYLYAMLFLSSHWSQMPNKQYMTKPSSTTQHSRAFRVMRAAFV